MFKRFLYYIYGGDTARRASRFTKEGYVLLGVLIASALIGLDTRRTVVYQIFTFALALFVFSLVWSVFSRIRLTATRRLPEFGTVGESLEYRIILQNHTSKPQKGLYLVENVAGSRLTVAEFMNTPEPGEERRNLYDRTLLVYRWRWLTLRKQGAKIPEQPLPTLPPDSEGEVRIEMMPVRRGYIQLTGMTIARPDPLNFFRAFKRIPLQQSVLILPKRYVLPSIQLPGSRKFKLGGVALASSVGESEEFVSLRDYRPGDPLRRIHWRSWAKTGKPIVKEYQDEYFVRHALVLDTFQRAEYSEIFEEAVSIAASCVSTLQTQDSLVDLMFVGTEAYCFTSGRSVAHTDQMLKILASVSTCRDQPFRVLPPIVFERASLLSGCICIFLTWDTERKDFVKQLKELGVPLFVLVLTDGTASQVLDPGPMQDMLQNFHQLEVGKIQDGLARL